jgi:hypothetical protein
MRGRFLAARRNTSPAERNVSTFKVGTLLVTVLPKKACGETFEMCGETFEVACGETQECVPRSCGLTLGAKGKGCDVADASGYELQQLKLHLRAALTRAGKRAGSAPKAKKASKKSKKSSARKKPGK